jgi:hypothetical protein
MSRLGRGFPNNALMWHDAPGAASVPFSGLAPAASPNWGSLVVPLAA